MYIYFPFVNKIYICNIHYQGDSYKHKVLVSTTTPVWQHLRLTCAWLGPKGGRGGLVCVTWWLGEVGKSSREGGGRGWRAGRDPKPFRGPR